MKIAILLIGTTCNWFLSTEKFPLYFHQYTFVFFFFLNKFIFIDPVSIDILQKFRMFVYIKFIFRIYENNHAMKFSFFLFMYANSTINIVIYFQALIKFFKIVDQSLYYHFL